MFHCSYCGEDTLIWSRRCPTCVKELTLREKPEIENHNANKDEAAIELEYLPTGFELLDTFFNGGFLKTFLYFIYAREGAGKTTFLLQVCSYQSLLGKSVVYFIFDDSIEGIKKKTSEYSLDISKIHFISENVPGIFEKKVKEYKPELVVIDSIQSMVKYKVNQVQEMLYKVKAVAKEERFTLIVIGEKNRLSNNYLGSSSIGHIVDVPIRMTVGLDDEVIVSTPHKNRDTNNKTGRCFFKKTKMGLVEIPEIETGYLPRHKEKSIIGFAPFVGKYANDYFVDEITTLEDNTSKKLKLSIVGMTQVESRRLLTLVSDYFSDCNSEYLQEAHKITKNLEDAELACIVALLSMAVGKPVPVDNVFIGKVDNRGFLMPVEGMEQRVERARGLGYKRIFGPMANGILTPIWTDMDTVWDVVKVLELTRNGNNS